MILRDKNIRSILLLGIVILLSVGAFTVLGSNESNTKDEDVLEEMLLALDGINDVRIAYRYSGDAAGGSLEGLAITYKGGEGVSTDIMIYELVHALYDIPYSRIYVSH